MENTTTNIMTRRKKKREKRKKKTNEKHTVLEHKICYIKCYALRHKDEIFPINIKVQRDKERIQEKRSHC